jgi:hypothetical protein
MGAAAGGAPHVRGQGLVCGLGSGVGGSSRRPGGRLTPCSGTRACEEREAEGRHGGRAEGLAAACCTPHAAGAFYRAPGCLPTCAPARVKVRAPGSWPLDCPPDCPGLRSSLPANTPDDCEVLCELVAVLGVQVAAHVGHQLLEARREVRLALGGLAHDDLDGRGGAGRGGRVRGWGVCGGGGDVWVWVGRAGRGGGLGGRARGRPRKLAAPRRGGHESSACGRAPRRLTAGGRRGGGGQAGARARTWRCRSG